MAAFAAVFLLAAGSAAGLVAGPAIGGAGPAALASSQASVTDAYVPGQDPWGTAFDSSGEVWVALPGCDGTACSSSSAPGKLGLFNPVFNAWATVVTLPAGYGQPLFVAVDGGGKVWFTMPGTNSIGAYDPGSGSVTQWPVPTAGAGPWGIAIDASGKIWFTEHYLNKIASFNPATNVFQEVATPDTNSNPYGIVVDSSNNVWFTENTDAVASIDEYTSGGVLKQFKVRSTSTAGTGLTPHLLTIAANGTIWWSEGFAAAIGSLNPAAAQPGTAAGVTENFYPLTCNNCGAHTSGIGVDSQGNIWWDDSNQSIFGSFPVAGGTFSEFSTPTGNSHPHDGLNVDSQNRIWFDEEFANKLAEAVQSGATTSPSPTTTSPSPTTSTSTPPPAGSLGTDTFQRANHALWGTASDGQVWGGDANTASVFSISGNAGVVKNTGGTSYSAVLGPSATDSEVFATGSLSTFANANFGDVLRWTDGNNWYKAYIDGQNLVLQKKVAGATTVVATAPFAATAGVSYTIHFRVAGSTLTANVWPSSGAEPSGWMVTATDSGLASGRAGMRFLTQGGTATITAFVADVPGSGTPSPSPTTTSPSPSPTTPSPTTTSPSPTPTTPSPTTSTSTPPPAGSLGTDTFQRANQALWGTASDGQVWGGDANTASVFSISGNAGVVRGGGGNSYSAVLGPSATNSEVFATGSLSTFANANFGDVLRWTDGNNWYKAYIDGHNLVLQKKVAGATTVVATAPFAATAGVSYTIHFRVVGSTLTANAWASSGTEPSGWMVTATDSGLASGRAGLRLLPQSGTITVTAFQANQL